METLNETTPGGGQGSTHKDSPAMATPANEGDDKSSLPSEQAKTDQNDGLQNGSHKFVPFTNGMLHCLQRAHRLVKLRLQLGRDVVFVPMAWGTKTPTVKGYTEFTADTMENIALLDELERNNIAFLTGPNSGHLVSIDFDNFEAAEEFLTLNGNYFDTAIRIYGARGFNLLFRLKGPYPQGCHRLKHQDENIGEFRAGGCVTIVAGKHPSGVNYRIEGNMPPTLGFEKILWPLDWKSSCIKTAYDILVEKFGSPFEKHGRRVAVNERWFVGKLAMEHHILHDPTLGFYQYDAASGVWRPQTEAAIEELFSRDSGDCAAQFGEVAILNLRNARLLKSLTAQLRGHREVIDAFESPQRHLVHTSDGMLDLSSGSPCLTPFDPQYHSLHQLPWHYDERATCPRFLEELLRPALSESDISLLQKLCGQVVLGQNLCQKLVILEGPGGSGKGTLSEILDLVIGERNVAELRTSHLGGRFEMSAFLGKVLLCGRDVPGTFLNGSGASLLKKLTGGDLLEVEFKAAQKRRRMRGCFNIFITTNSRLLVAIEGDKSAWERRLVVLPFERGPVAKPIPNFAQLLMREEGPGIFAWMVQGAIKTQKDIDEFGTLSMSALQRQRVQDVLLESDSIASFLMCRTVADATTSVQTAALYNAYRQFCGRLGFEAVQERLFEKRIRGELLAIHGARQSENIIQCGIRRRGYLAVRLLDDAEPDLPAARHTLNTVGASLL